MIDIDADKLKKCLGIYVYFTIYKLFDMVYVFYIAIKMDKFRTSI